MADKLCGFDYLVYGLREWVVGDGLFVFIQHWNEKMYLIKIYISPSNTNSFGALEVHSRKGRKSSISSNGVLTY